METDQPYEWRSTSEINHRIKTIIGTDDGLKKPLWISGEIQRYRLADSGHSYFEINDDGYSLACFIHARINEKLKFQLKKGLLVDLRGTITVYARHEEVQLDVERVKLSESTPYQPDDSVLKQLADQGLWPQEKKPLPKAITTIALITSKNSRAKDNFTNAYQEDGGKAEISCRYVPLEGDRAVREIADTINAIGSTDEFDVVVITRGGGRREDLSIFNDIQIVEAICRCPFPVITGIGHHKDSTFADLVADISASTPTRAATYLTRPFSLDVPSPTKHKTSTVFWMAFVIIILVLVSFVILFFLLNGTT